MAMVSKHPKQPALPTRQGRLSARTRSYLAASSVAVLLITGLQIYLWWVSPEHRLAQFIGAVSQGASARILSLADDNEIKHMRLMPDKLHDMLNEVAGVPGGLKLGDIIEEPLNNHQMGFNRLVKIALLDAGGKPLLNSKGGEAYAYTYAYQTDSGWKIGISHFLYAVYYARYKSTHLVYADFCTRYQMPPEILYPTSGIWEPIPTRQQSVEARKH